MNFYELLGERAKSFGDKIFLQIDEQIFTYKNFLQADSTSEFFNQAKNFLTSNRENIFEVRTGGSTGKPKALSRTFESWAEFFPTQNKIFRLDEHSKVFMHGDLNFTGNLNTFLAVLHAGGTIVTSEKFAPKTWLELIKNSTARRFSYITARASLVSSRTKKLPPIMLPTFKISASRSTE